MVKKTGITLLLLYSLLVFTGCRFNYDETMIAEEIEEDIPDTILTEFTQVMVKDSSPAFLIEASESWSFGKKKETHFKNIHFQEYDKNGDIITDGKAENALMFTETENVEIWGGLYFYSKEESATLEGDYLFWDNEKSVLTGKSDESVKIVKDDSSAIEGAGFYADSNTRTIKFESGVSGRWVNSE